MTIMALALLAAASTQPEINVVDRVGGGFSANVVQFDAPELDAINNRIIAVAKQKCGSMRPRFGRHSFATRVDSGRNIQVIENFRQTFFCYDPATDIYQPVAADWTASAADTAEATAFLNRLLGHVETGNSAGMAMFDPLIEISAGDWKLIGEDVKRHRTGTAGSRLTPETVSWLKNPDWAAYPGAYAFFRLADSNPGIAKICGGILLQRVSAKEFRVSQFDLRFVSKALVDRDHLTNADLDELCNQ